jgi:hypothetical protein
MQVIIEAFSGEQVGCVEFARHLSAKEVIKAAATGFNVEPSRIFLLDIPKTHIFDESTVVLAGFRAYFESEKEAVKSLIMNPQPTCPPTFLNDEGYFTFSDAIGPLVKKEVKPFQIGEGKFRVDMPYAGDVVRKIAMDVPFHMPFDLLFAGNVTPPLSDTVCRWHSTLQPDGTHVLAPKSGIPIFAAMFTAFRCIADRRPKKADVVYEFLPPAFRSKIVRQSFFLKDNNNTSRVLVSGSVARAVGGLSNEQIASLLRYDCALKTILTPVKKTESSN